MLHAGGVDALDGRVLRHVDLEARGVEDLRDDAKIGQSRPIAVAESAGPVVFGNQGLVGVEAGLDPVARPGEGALLGLAELLAQTLDSAPSDWRRQMIQRAIEDVRAFAETDRS